MRSLPTSLQAADVVRKEPRAGSAPTTPSSVAAPGTRPLPHRPVFLLFSNLQSSHSLAPFTMKRQSSLSFSPQRRRQGPGRFHFCLELLCVELIIAAQVLPAPASATLTALAAISPTTARKTLQRLIDGYTDPRSGSGYAAAKGNGAGCILAQKQANRTVRGLMVTPFTLTPRHCTPLGTSLSERDSQENGYIQIAPVSEATRGLAGSSQGRIAPQNAHRLAVIAYKR